MVFRDTKFHAKIIKLMFLIFHWGHDVSVSLLGYVKMKIFQIFGHLQCISDQEFEKFSF